MLRNIIYDGDRWERVSDAVIARLEVQREVVRCTGDCTHANPVRPGDVVYHLMNGWRGIDNELQARCRVCDGFLGDSGRRAVDHNRGRVNMKISEADIRKFARAGALEMCMRAVTEFPDILTELNAAARRVAPARRVVIKGGPDVSGAPVRTPKKRTWSKVQRAAASARMKARWAKKRKK